MPVSQIRSDGLSYIDSKVDRYGRYLVVVGRRQYRIILGTGTVPYIGT